MRRISLASALSSFVFLTCLAFALGQSGPAVSSANGQGTAQGRPASAQPAQPVSYASMTQLNGILTQLESTSRSTQADLAKLRIERWKTDANSKKQPLANVDSIQRN